MRIATLWELIYICPFYLSYEVFRPEPASIISLDTHVTSVHIAPTSDPMVDQAAILQGIPYKFTLV